MAGIGRAGPAGPLLALALVAAAWRAGAAPAEGAAPSAVLQLRFGGDDARTRVVIDADATLSASLADGREDPPTRVVLILPGVHAADGLEGGGQGLVRAWKIENQARGARLTLELTHAGRIAHRFLLAPTGANAHFRYVIDVAETLAATDSPGVDATPPPAPAVPTLPPASQAERLAPVALAPVHVRRARSASRVRVVDTASAIARRARKVVVIDAGHGGHDPGAQSWGISEKDITLACAFALQARLERDGRYKVVMTRDADVFIPLESRVRMARRAGADLFISLHADAAGADPRTHGASVYTLSDHGESRVAQVLGTHEWFNRSGPRASDPAVGRILLDLTQRSTVNRSAAVAGLLVDRIGAAVDLLPNTHRDAGYYVLLAPDVPAVLIEMGFISNPLDEARLVDPAQRDKLMDAAADAIDAYFTDQTTLAAR
ncbi:MAG: N-acetylmuramoyl-L-alanine amidase family protein [Caulobacteraceae bacterium]